MKNWEQLKQLLDSSIDRDKAFEDLPPREPPPRYFDDDRVYDVIMIAIALALSVLLAILLTGGISV